MSEEEENDLVVYVAMTFLGAIVLSGILAAVIALAFIAVWAVSNAAEFLLNLTFVAVFLVMSFFVGKALFTWGE